MEPALQRRVQRYGWDLAAASYEPLWRAQLASAQTTLIARATLVFGHVCAAATSKRSSLGDTIEVTASRASSRS
jgi:hypothetical protein